MKKDFIGYYAPTEAEIEDSWTKGVFVFDANTLLNLYRYTEQTSKDFLSAIEALKDKIYLPYQAAHEFHNNRQSVINNMQAAYDFLGKTIEDNYQDNLLKNVNQFKKHPTIDINKIKKLHDEFVKQVKIELKKQEKAHYDIQKNDNILDQLTTLFNNYTGSDFPKDKLDKLYTEGKARYEERVPPGYQDSKSKQGKGDRHIYGDLIIWVDMIEYCKSNKRPLIFITDDNKEDWWKIENGERKMPRPELIKEFYDKTDIRILIYNPDQFLKLAKQRDIVKALHEETIEEIKEVRKSDQSYEHTKIIENEFMQFKIKHPDKLEQKKYNPRWASVLSNLKEKELLEPNSEFDADKFFYMLDYFSNFKKVDVDNDNGTIRYEIR